MAEQQHHPGISDVVEVMGTLLISDDGSSRYLGKSAANALFHEVHSDRDAASEGSDSEDDDAASTAASALTGRPYASAAFPWVSRSLDVSDFQALLPPMNEARAFADSYYFYCSYVRIHTVWKQSTTSMTLFLLAGV